MAMALIVLAPVVLALVVLALVVLALAPGAAVAERQPGSTPTPTPRSPLVVELPSSSVAGAGASRIEIRAAAPAAETLARMRLWHPTYRRRFSPLEISWRRLVHAYTARPDRYPARECSGLLAALSALDEAGLPVPADRVVLFYLQETLAHLRRAASDCRQDRFFAATYRLDEARRSLQRAGRRLRAYGLEP